MKFLLTGAAGFTGSRACLLLARRGHRVIPVTHRNSNLPSHAAIQPPILTDLRRRGGLDPSRVSGLDLVVHLAAALPSSFSGEDARAAAEANHAMDRNVFELCTELGVGVVYSSGASVYGDTGAKAADETSPLSPPGPYVVAKVKSEEFGQGLLEGAGLPFTALRISAPYGPDQLTRTVLQIFVENAARGRTLHYYGSGTRQQDFVHVDDVARAIVRAARTSSSGIFNVASGRPITMKSLAETVVSLIPGCEADVQPSHRPDPQEGWAARYDIGKAKRQLGWAPRVSLEEGLAELISARSG